MALFPLRGEAKRTFRDLADLARLLPRPICLLPKALWALVLPLTLLACQPLSPYASTDNESLTPLRPDSALFRSEAGHLFLRLPFRQTHEDRRYDPPYTFWDCLWSQDQQHQLALQQVVDVTTFRPVPGTHNYWVDKHYVYTAPYFDEPGQKPLFILGRVGSVHFLADPDSAYAHGTYYYKGAFVWRERAPRRAPAHFNTHLP